VDGAVFGMNYEFFQLDIDLVNAEVGSDLKNFIRGERLELNIVQNVSCVDCHNSSFHFKLFQEVSIKEIGRDPLEIEHLLEYRVGVLEEFCMQT
jgi:hypothetical protein